MHVRRSWYIYPPESRQDDHGTNLRHIKLKLRSTENSTHGKNCVSSSKFRGLAVDPQIGSLLQAGGFTQTSFEPPVQQGHGQQHNNWPPRMASYTKDVSTPQTAGGTAGLSSDCYRQRGGIMDHSQQFPPRPRATLKLARDRSPASYPFRSFHSISPTSLVH